MLLILVGGLSITDAKRGRPGSNTSPASPMGGGGR